MHAKTLADAAAVLRHWGMPEAADLIERQAAGLEALRAAVRDAVHQNGGPIDASDTIDGVDYVMVRRADFDALVVLLDAARTGGGKP